MWENFLTSQVFVPGGMPKHTYVRRDDGEREELLAEIKEGVCKLVCLSGPTKSGKTVLANKVFPRAEGASVWIDGGSIRSEEDLWRQIIQCLDGFGSVEVSHQDESVQGTQGGIEAGLRFPLLASGKGKVDVSVTRKSAYVEKKSLELSAPLAALEQLKLSRKPLIIDDFHYLSPDVQATVVRTLKSLIFNGHLVIVISIPQRRHDVIRKEPEFTGRVETIQVPAWSREELRKIATLGFPLLNVQVSSEVCNGLAAEAQGSPHLMQELCRHLCRYHKIRAAKFELRPIFFLGNRDMWDLAETPILHAIHEASDSVFKGVANDVAKPIFEKLARGPLVQSQRRVWLLKQGGHADIYSLLLIALAKLAPGLERVDLEMLRGVLKDLIDGAAPKVAEVMRAIENIVQIARKDEAKVPVLDWDAEEKQLFITDPFFAFYLKWGVEGEDSGFETLIRP